MIYKVVLVSIAIITLILNIFLTVYMLRIIKRNRSNRIKQVVTFQLPQDYKSDALYTDILEEEDNTLQL